MTEKRETQQSPAVQGVDEEIAYTLTTTPWGTSPSSISVKVYSVPSSGADSDHTDVTSTVMPTGSPSAAGDIITLPVLKLLTLGTLYRVEVKFTCSGNVFEVYSLIQAER